MSADESNVAKGRDLKAVKRGHLEKVLNRELDRNPCYFEERTAKACQNLVDFEQATRGGQIPLGGFRREASTFCSPLMKNFDDCKEFWEEIKNYNYKNGISFHVKGDSWQTTLPLKDERKEILDTNINDGYTPYRVFTEMPPKKMSVFKEFIIKFNKETSDS